LAGGIVDAGFFLLPVLLTLLAAGEAWWIRSTALVTERKSLSTDVIFLVVLWLVDAIFFLYCLTHPVFL
jgi:hypothetical protein